MGKRISLEEFIERAIKKHGPIFDYSKTKLIGMKFKITVICPIHGEFYPIANDHTGPHNKSGCPTCSYAQHNHTKNVKEKKTIDPLTGKSKYELRYENIHKTRKSNDNYVSAAKKTKETKENTIVNGKNLWEIAEEKRYEKMLLNGKYIPLDQLSEFHKYNRLARRMSKKSMKKYGHLLGDRPENHDLDHIMSIYNGFLNNVPIEYIGHICNLRYLPTSENRKKHIRSDISLEQLIVLIKNFN